MEGMNMAGLLAGYLAVLVFGIISLVAFGFLLARRTRGARIVFAAGLLCATIIAGLALLSFLEPEFRHDASVALIFVATASLFLAGCGQFIAALRSARTYAAAFACAAVSLVLLASPLLCGDWGSGILNTFGLESADLGVPFLVAASLIPAVTSVVIAVLPLFQARHPSASRMPQLDEPIVRGFRRADDRRSGTGPK
jgi:hypothetical protein